jgi:uncharacterized membrane protein YfcA
MNFKIYLWLAIASIVGSSLGFLLGNEKDGKNIVAKGLAGLMIGLIIIPAFMKYFDLPIEVWVAVTSVASVVSIEIIILLTKKLKEYIDNKIKTN